jgi:hypothetical protein
MKNDAATERIICGLLLVRNVQELPLVSRYYRLRIMAVYERHSRNFFKVRRAPPIV